MIKTAAIIGLILIIMVSSVSAAGIGIGVVPSEIEIHDAMRGSEYEKRITIHNTAENDSGFSITAEGECSDWMHFYRMEDQNTEVTNITIPGKNNAKILVKITIPDDAASGEHTSKIGVQNIPIEGMVGSTMVVRMPVDVMIGVTGTQILTGAVKSITSLDTEVDHPLTIKVEFQNTGNVVAKPVVNVDISRDGTPVDGFTYSEMAVAPTKKEIIPVEWGTTEMVSGDYVAKVSVMLGEKVLETKDLQFKLLPIGTLSRRGNLTSISTESEPAIGMVKILATFVNTGGIDTRARFAGEVYRDGNLIDTIESNELLVPIRESGTLTSYLKIESPGNYAVKGHVEYEGRTTNTKELSFDVSIAAAKTGEEENSTNSTPGFGAAGGLSAILILIFALRKRTTR